MGVCSGDNGCNNHHLMSVGGQSMKASDIFKIFDLNKGES